MHLRQTGRSWSQRCFERRHGSQDCRVPLRRVAALAGEWERRSTVILIASCQRDDPFGVDGVYCVEEGSSEVKIASLPTQKGLVPCLIHLTTQLGSSLFFSLLFHEKTVIAEFTIFRQAVLNGANYSPTYSATCEIAKNGHEWGPDNHPVLESSSSIHQRRSYESSMKISNIPHIFGAQHGFTSATRAVPRPRQVLRKERSPPQCVVGRDLRKTPQTASKPDADMTFLKERITRKGR